MPVEDNEAVVARWFTGFWGSDFDASVIDALAAPDIRFEYSLHTPLRGRDQVREFALTFREAFPDLGFGATADLIAEGATSSGIGRAAGRTRAPRSTTSRSARCRRTRAGGWSSPVPP
jgi:hypothetical protein